MNNDTNRMESIDEFFLMTNKRPYSYDSVTASIDWVNGGEPDEYHMKM